MTKVEKDLAVDLVRIPRDTQDWSMKDYFKLTKAIWVIKLTHYIDYVRGRNTRSK
jgi:hypothetical protein